MCVCVQEIGTLIMNILRQITYQKEKNAKQEIPTLITGLHY